MVLDAIRKPLNIYYLSFFGPGNPLIHRGHNLVRRSIRGLRTSYECHYDSVNSVFPRPLILSLKDAIVGVSASTDDATIELHENVFKVLFRAAGVPLLLHCGSYFFQ
jgi:hypothetical protein